MLPDRNTAADNENMICDSALDRFEQGLALIKTMLHQVDYRAAALQQSAKQHRIAFVNLSRLKFASGLYKFVAGRDDRRFWLASDRYICNSLRRQKSHSSPAHP